jgi:hypothetical protein
MNFTNLFFQSCSRFIDDLSSHYPTGQRPISEHGEFEEAGHGVIKNFKKIGKKGKKTDWLPINLSSLST